MWSTAKGPINLSRFLAPFCPFCVCILCIHVNLFFFSDSSVHRGPGVAILTALSSLATWGCHNYKLKCDWRRHGWGGGGSRLSVCLCMCKIWCTQWITCAKMANKDFEKKNVDTRIFIPIFTISTRGNWSPWVTLNKWESIIVIWWLAKTNILRRIYPGFNILTSNHHNPGWYTWVRSVTGKDVHIPF